MSIKVRGLFVGMAMSILIGVAFGADEADGFFDDSVVREVRLTFQDPNWYETLYQSHANDPEDPYFPARFEAEGAVLDPVGVRFKGNSSFRIDGQKKSFKIDFNEYDDEGVFLEMKKLNLNNGFMDPTLLREKLFLDFSSRYVPTVRAVHCRVFVNGEYWGLYTAVEQMDKTFVQSRFGGDEDGNLFEGETPDGEVPADAFGSDLTWLGSDPAPYHTYYELKTNEGEDDYSQLIAFIDVLNNTPAEALPGALEPLFDVDSWLDSLALNMLFVNLDSYCGSAHNYYLYDRDDTGRITHLFWDTNEAFGTFTFGIPPFEDPLHLDPHWLPSAPPGGPAWERPLMESLWAVGEYDRTYLRALARMLREGFDTVAMDARIRELADRIRADVYADTKKPTTNAQFETNLTSDVVSGNRKTFGLRHFVQERSSYLNTVLDTLADETDFRLNEVMSFNVDTVQDGAGDFDPWVEITNLGPGEVNIQGLCLSDEAGNPAKWALPAASLDSGEYLVFWLDGEPQEGADHASFTLQAGGGELNLSLNDGTCVDQVPYPALAAGGTFGRFGDGEGEWDVTTTPTPGSSNIWTREVVTLRINELMADNDTTIQDPDGIGGYPDWIEVYNPNGEAVDMGGMYLTDDLADPTLFRIPDGVAIEAFGYLLFWADNDSDQGSTHTNFKLSAGGEAVGLFDVDRAGNAALDTVTFGEQEPDISYGRFPDGAGDWQALESPTPGSPNLTEDPFPGDCDGDGGISIGEVQRAVNMFLGGEPAGCGGDCDTDGRISIGEVQRVINNFLGVQARCS